MEFFERLAVDNDGGSAVNWTKVYMGFVCLIYCFGGLDDKHCWTDL